MKNQQQGMIVLLAGPSGVGKNVLIKALMKMFKDIEVCFSVSATTRPPREGEVDGVNYLFWNNEQFHDAIHEHHFLEYEKCKTTFYGTLKLPIEEALTEGRIVFMDLDWSGASQIRIAAKKNGWKHFDAFVLPPSFDVLEDRLRQRCNSLDEEEIQARLTRARKEMDHQFEFQHRFTNQDLADCAREIFQKIQLVHPSV